MSFNNVPVNGWPQIKDLERLDALAKQIEDMPVYTSDDRAFLDTWERDLPILAEDVSDLETTKANQATIAPTFNSETAYDDGDLVYYNGLTYRCTNAHEGEWDADDFAATTVSNEIDALKSGLTDVNSQFNVSSASQDYTGTSSGGNAFTYKIRKICKNIYLVLVGITPISSVGAGNTDTIELTELSGNIVFGVTQNTCTISSSQRDPSLTTIPISGTKTINLWGAMTEARTFEILAMLVL